MVRIVALVLSGVVVGAALAAPRSRSGGRTGRGDPAVSAEPGEVEASERRRGRRKGRASRGEGPAQIEPEAKSPKAAPTPLDGTKWILQSYRGGDGQMVAPIEGSLVTGQFRSGRIVTGSGGCNDFTAGYTYDAGALTVSRAATTHKACESLMMDQEKAYLAALHRAARFVRADDWLTLQGRDGAALLVYQPEPPPVISGAEWRMTAFNAGKAGFVSGRRDVSVTAVFGADGQVTGSGGCNDYKAKFTQAGDRLIMGPIILLSRKPCAAEVLAQERAFLAALRSATRVDRDGGQLLLTRGDDTQVASFSAAPAPARPAEQAAATS